MRASGVVFLLSTVLILLGLFLPFAGPLNLFTTFTAGGAIVGSVGQEVAEESSTQAAQVSSVMGGLSVFLQILGYGLLLIVLIGIILAFAKSKGIGIIQLILSIVFFIFFLLVGLAGGIQLVTVLLIIGLLGELVGSIMHVATK
jgi:hypothetical protein